MTALISGKLNSAHWILLVTKMTDHSLLSAYVALCCQCLWGTFFASVSVVLSCRILHEMTSLKCRAVAILLSSCASGLHEDTLLVGCQISLFPSVDTGSVSCPCRLVWSRIWAVLSDYFIQVGCSSNLSVAMYAVDSLRQLSMKFLERDELANYTFQNDFLKPFVVVMRQSKAVEIRELIIRCVSQMVLARVNNVKSGWKSMFMVFTTAAGDCFSITGWEGKLRCIDPDTKTHGFVFPRLCGYNIMFSAFLIEYGVDMWMVKNTVVL